MKYSITEDGKAAYLQLYEQLRRDIVSGVYPHGGKLPSKRLLAEETGVSVITVEHAYGILCDEGYVEARQRSGYYVIYRESDFISHTSAFTPSPHTHMNGQHTDSEFPFSVLGRTMRRVMAEYAEELLARSPNRGCVELRHAIASYLARSCGITAHPEQIIIGSGAEYLYSLIVQLLGNDRVYGVEDPCYEKIRQVYKANGAKIERMKMGSDGIRTDELARSTATVLHITPFNSYPSGVTADVSKRMEYLRFIRQRNGFIIEDNYDSELTVSRKNEDTVFSLSSEGSVIYLNTFSRTVAPSIRVGYMVLPEKLLPDFEMKLGFYACTVPTFEQYVLAELLTSGDFERHINRIRRKRRKAQS
ncbi:MAG: PLP-dependent aminotransferase family protein [Ruminococcaceae bacterium]|nr:PLP-dependent aminotransferase family protein [Oscillospiraceae bacterium]